MKTKIIITSITMITSFTAKAQEVPVTPVPSLKPAVNKMTASSSLENEMVILGEYELLPMTVFPEVVYKNISVSIPFFSNSNGKLNIYDERGDVVYYKYLPSVQNVFEVAIPSSITPGNYFIQVIADGKHAIQKFVKK